MVRTLGTPLILADCTAPKALAGLPCSALALTAVESEPRKDVAALPWRKLAFRRGIWMALLTAMAGLPAGEERLRAVPLESDREVGDVAVLLLPRSKEPPVAAYAVPESATTSETTEIAVAGDGRCTMCSPFSSPSGTRWPLGGGPRSRRVPVRSEDSTTGAAHFARARRLQPHKFPISRFNGHAPRIEPGSTATRPTQASAMSAVKSICRFAYTLMCRSGAAEAQLLASPPLGSTWSFSR